MPTTLCVLHDPRDRLLARRIAADLVAYGVSARGDLAEMRPGDTLARRLMEGALSASALLVLVTDASAAAPWLGEGITPELWTIIGRNWRVLVGRVHVERLPARLTRAPVVDLADYPNGFSTLLRLL